MRKIIRMVLILIGIIIIAIAGLLTYVKIGLPNIEKATDLKIDYTPERIERGKYLANNVMICMDCHSQRDYSKFGAPLKPGTFGAGGELFGTDMGFPGNFYSANLTPYHLKDWTDGELFRAITTGVSRDGRALFPIMPYPNFSRADKEDIYSVIAYIRTLEPVQYDVPKSEAKFPMNFIINTIPREATFSQRPDKKDQLAYGKYLATSASCGDCHTRKDKGEPIQGMDFAGGMEFKFPDHTVLRSANITPDKETGIGSWTEEEFLNRFRAFRDSTFVPSEVKEGEFRTLMPWLFYSKMEEDDLRAIFTYLKSLTPVTHKVVKFEKVAAPKEQAMLNK
jgi:mono/diheme cytochrome c family protein